MTCRFELEFQGKPYPRSCPTCGLSGKCHKDYKQVTNGNDPGYRIYSPDSGKVYASSNSPDYIKNSANGPTGAVGTTGPDVQAVDSNEAIAERERRYYEARARGEDVPIPSSILIRRGEEAAGNMQRKLEEEAAARNQAANPKAVAISDLGLPSGDKLRGKAILSVRVLDTSRRLKLIGYLVDNFDKRGQYTIHELDAMVDKIAAILLDD